MTQHRTGNATPERRTARAGTLSLREPHVEKLLAGLNLDDDLSEIRQFCKAMTRARSSWDIERRRTGIFGSRQLSKVEAGKVLKVALERGSQ